MTSSAVRLLIIDDDPIFRMGLLSALEPFSDLEVVADVESLEGAFRVLETGINSEGQKPVDLIILELGLKIKENPAVKNHPVLDFCQQLKTQYPKIPILLLTTVKQPYLLLTAQKIGVDGYCNKGIPVRELVIIINQLVAGERYWLESLAALNREPVMGIVSRKTGSFLGKIQGFLVQPGLRQIEQAIAEVNQEIKHNLEQFNQQDTITIINKLILTGKRRELLTARWIVSQLSSDQTSPNLDDSAAIASNNFNSDNYESMNNYQNSALVITSNPTHEQSSGIVANNLKSVLFDKTVIKLQSGLINLTGMPLEIDILRLSKKRELLYILLKQLEILLDELILSDLQYEQLAEKIPSLITEFWQSATMDFFGKYYTVTKNNQNIEIVTIILKDADLIQNNILNKIPLVKDLFEHLLFCRPLTIDNLSCPAGALDAMERAEALLQNLLIQVANAIIQPLLNYFSDYEEIKLKFYDRRLLSTREIEKFRNSLSWRYRLDQYVAEPQAIFESSYLLLVLGERGIQKQVIYSPRRDELEKLSGIPLTVTLILETRDAVAPPLRAAISFVGSAIIYVLTNVVGRGLGLIGKGILQGIGTSFKDSRTGKK
jgi:DNA-binding NarL/FixJ family response regulator